MSSGQLILLDDDPTKNVIYEPVDGSLCVGSANDKVHVCLNGLNDKAFTIYIDPNGRVS